ncbi:hypothetical protein C8F04DRAFT_1280534 [Mycena alexandri]|uniref:Uncharacterized protein n=1 Tax=Mycena alexandri TaxID=1745969 RepID=A0AAD6RXI0_9AGAR|nr:hypothetical protein C8F04DRAFT_1280534 [Mycena alexandri]
MEYNGHGARHVALSVWVDSGPRKQWSRVRRDLYCSYRSARLFSKRRTPLRGFPIRLHQHHVHAQRNTLTNTDTFTPNGNSNAYTYPNTSYSFTATGSCDSPVHGAESDRASIVTIAAASTTAAADAPAFVPDALSTDAPLPALTPASVQHQDEPTVVHHSDGHELDPIAELTVLSSIPGLVPHLGPLYIGSVEPEPISGDADVR